MDALLASASPRLGFSATVTSTPNAKRDSHECRYPSFFVPPSPSQDDASELPSIVVEDLTFVSPDDSTRTVLTSPRMPVWDAFPAAEEPSPLWAHDVTLVSPPPCGRKECSLEKPWLDASTLKEYPKSPPAGRPRTDSLRTFASSMEVLEKMASPAASVVTLRSGRSGEGRSRKKATDEGSKSPAARPAKGRAPASPHMADTSSAHTTQSLRKRGPSANLREAYVRNLSRTHPALDPRYAFEYQLTLAILDAMERAPPRRPRPAGQGDKQAKAKRLSAPFVQSLGSLKRRVPSLRAASVVGL
ncbi:hypothetical protein PsYK624_024070 [Phanerochaete sordida]|uniref:Uncharacterized protein n=1 Tax=Phanerochaete sordida TaxID=48140 RepID=A0A9P3G1E3_9APHY|nr:hypothetical protein PsYK624_024070 [Phanerochaete sordida]